MLVFASRLFVFVSLACAHAAFAQSLNQPIEPKAGTWKTWVISSGREFRVPPPPDAVATNAELAWLQGAVAEKDSRIAAQVAFWDSGPTGY